MEKEKELKKIIEQFENVNVSGSKWQKAFWDYINIQFDKIYKKPWYQSWWAFSLMYPLITGIIVAIFLKVFNLF